MAPSPLCIWRAIGIPKAILQYSGSLRARLGAASLCAHYCTTGAGFAMGFACIIEPSSNRMGGPSYHMLHQPTHIPNSMLALVAVVHIHRTLTLNCAVTSARPLVASPRPTRHRRCNQSSALILPLSTAQSVWRIGCEQLTSSLRCLNGRAVDHLVKSVRMLIRDLGIGPRNHRDEYETHNAYVTAQH